jgi:hypothetical protein
VIFEQLPPSVREALGWDAAAEEALARANELPYESIQEIAFAAAPPLVPAQPSREIPFGRWAWLPAASQPPGGFVIRYLVGTYAETLVQVCVAENLTVERDALGRITRIADPLGAEIRTTYDDTVPPLEVAGEAGMKGYAFSTISVVGPTDLDDPRRLLTASHPGIGWALVGALAGGGTAQNGGRFVDASARYTWALDQKAELQRLDAELTRVHPGRPAGPAASAARLLDLANYCEALRLALTTGLPEGDPEHPHVADRLGLAYRAWIAEFAGFCRGSVPGGILSLAETSAPPSGSLRSAIRLAGAGPQPKPDILDQTIFRLFDWMFQTRHYQAQPANSGSQNIGLAGRVTQAAKALWNSFFAGHRKNTTIVTTAFKVTKMPSFLGIPQAMIVKLINIDVDLYFFAGDAIWTAGGEKSRRLAGAGAAGPPLVRDDYDVATVAQVWDPGPLEAGPGISAERLAASQAMQDRMLELAAHLHAGAVAIERQAGAARAGDSLWYNRQGAYAVHYERQAGALMWDVSDAIEAWVQVLVAEGVEDVWVTKEELDAVTARLQTQGYSAEERDLLRHLGLNDDEIARCLELAKTPVDVEDGVPAVGSLRDYGISLREAGWILQQLPVPFHVPGK